ncbi:hypothetical protein FBFR_13340 [Flavobacterium fryxellicola]|uniref:Uncharacterized protein n=1 Tax=Flavobacterium fryxellicola TaxID=249352 RepID=A0A167VA82_9FLAO|nr:hypothetical protein FBFR_13340 [Flavobacterium fryxellicola]
MIVKRPILVKFKNNWKEIQIIKKLFLTLTFDINANGVNREIYFRFTNKKVKRLLFIFPKIKSYTKHRFFYWNEAQHF